MNGSWVGVTDAPEFLVAKLKVLKRTEEQREIKEISIVRDIMNREIRLVFINFLINKTYFGYFRTYN